jgi:hypothetical protein
MNEGQMDKHSFEQFKDAGCEFFSGSPVPFMAVHIATNGNVCQTGCAWYEGGRCPAYRTLTAKPVLPDAPKGETVREAAARLGVSISEIRRQRRGAA